MRTFSSLLLFVLLVWAMGCSFSDSRQLLSDQDKSSPRRVSWRNVDNTSWLWPGMNRMVLQGDRSNNRYYSASRLDIGEDIAATWSWNPDLGEVLVHSTPVAHAIRAFPEEDDAFAYRLYVLGEDEGNQATLFALDPKSESIDWYDELSSGTGKNMTSVYAEIERGVVSQGHDLFKAWIFTASSDGTLSIYADDAVSGTLHFEEVASEPSDAVFGSPNVRWDAELRDIVCFPGFVEGGSGYFNWWQLESDNDGDVSLIAKGSESLGTLLADGNSASTPCIIFPDNVEFPDGVALIWVSDYAASSPEALLAAYDLADPSRRFVSGEHEGESMPASARPRLASVVEGIKSVGDAEIRAHVSTPTNVRTFAVDGADFADLVNHTTTEIPLADTIAVTTSTFGYTWRIASQPVWKHFTVGGTPRHLLFFVEQDIDASPYWRVRAEEYVEGSGSPSITWLSSLISGYCFSQPYVDENGYVYVSGDDRVYAWKAWDSSTGNMSTSGASWSFQSASGESTGYSSVSAPVYGGDIEDTLLYVGADGGKVLEFENETAP